jgi:hypothetical protein
MSHESRPLAIRAWYQPESVGYSRLSLSKALHSAISLPHVFDQLAQLAPLVGKGTSSDTSLPLGRCSAINTYLTSISMASAELSEGGLEQVSVLKVSEEQGKLGPLHAVSATVEVVAGGREGI